MGITKKVSSVTNRQKAILIFSKAPESGKVKTRMRPFLTEAQCLELHLTLLRDVLAKASGTQNEVYLYLSGPASLPFDPGVPVLEQHGTDLGERMLNAFSERLEDHDRVVIVGIDSPSFESGRFEEAFGLLKDHDIVLGPAQDGGYYLIGLSKLLPEVFHGIDWGTEAVFHQTLSAAANRSVAELPVCYDIDTPEDLDRLRNELSQSDHWPCTARWIREMTTKLGE